MALPEPQLGLVISYSFLWHDEYRKGLDEGRKDRPCVIVVSTRIDESGDTIVRVAPVTHSQPADPNHAIEIPAAVKRHLGLDDARSWVILNEYNEFAWPGYDLRSYPPPSWPDLIRPSTANRWRRCARERVDARIKSGQDGVG